MTFLNMALLGGALAGLLPWIIHLWHRSRLKTVAWGPMFLLRSQKRRNQRLPRMEHWLLLLLRIALPVLLALCMARPVLSRFSGLHGSSPVSLVVLLDRSASMGADPDGRSCLQRACEEAARIIRQLPRGSEVAILTLDAPHQPLVETTTRLKSAAEFLAQIRPGSTPARIPGSLEAAAKTLAEMHHAQRTVLLLSDFQRYDWRESDSAERLRANRRLKLLTPAPRLVLFDIGQGTAPNLAVETLEFNRGPLGVEQPTTLRATLRNYGAKAVQDLRVSWRVDGIVKQESVLSLEARSSIPSLFTHRFPEPGSHLVEVNAEGDSIAADNSFWASFTVRERLPVLLVNGAPSATPLEGETDFLEMALQPQRETRNLLAPRVVDPSALNARTLASANVLVLANVKSLTPLQVGEIEQFVRNGGGLLIFPGNRMDARWYNEKLFRKGEGLLPAAFETLRNGDAQGRPTALPSSRFQHPALEPFGEKGLSLSETSIRSWFQLRPANTEGARSSAPSILAPLEHGDPFLVEGRFGQGAVIVSAIPCSPEWSNLPARPAFVPLMQRLVIHLGSTLQPPRNLAPGAPLIASFPIPPKNTPAAKSPQARLQRPDGSQYTAPLQTRGERWVLETEDTLEAGPYTVTGPGDELQRFVVNASREESDPELLTEAQVEELARAMEVQRVRTAAEYDALDRDARFGREIWPAVLGIALLCSFLELLVLRRFMVRKGVPA